MHSHRNDSWNGYVRRFMWACPMHKHIHHRPSRTHFIPNELIAIPSSIQNDLPMRDKMPAPKSAAASIAMACMCQNQRPREREAAMWKGHRGCGIPRINRAEMNLFAIYVKITSITIKSWDWLNIQTPTNLVQWPMHRISGSRHIDPDIEYLCCRYSSKSFTPNQKCPGWRRVTHSSYPAGPGSVWQIDRFILSSLNTVDANSIDQICSKN